VRAFWTNDYSGLIVVMATNAVGMAVRQLFSGGIAHFNNFQFKVEVFTGEWMVAVDIHIEFANF
jgi:hypothetical protein